MMTASYQEKFIIREMGTLSFFSRVLKFFLK